MSKKKKRNKGGSKKPPIQTKVSNTKDNMSIAEFQKTLSRLMLSDLKKRETVTYKSYTKEEYRRQIEDPVKNEKPLRDMSNFLFRVSMPYRRFINYLSDIPMFYWNIVPLIEDTNNVDKIMKNYNKTLVRLNNMSIPMEMRKVLTTVIREGVFYGFVYEDNKSFFIHKLNPDYCRIVEIEDGCYNFAFDMSYFDKYKTQIDFFDPYFKSLYDLYKSDSAYKWQLIDPQRSICIKVDPDVTDIILPQFIGLFEAVLDLIDARGLQRNKDEIQNYKLIIQKIPYFDNSKEVDDFSLDAETARRFYNMLNEVVPEAVGTVLSPMDIDTVDFDTDDDSNNIISSSMKTVFSDSGIAQLLFDACDVADGIEASIRIDVGLVWKLVECIERWIRRYISYHTTGKNKYHFEILRVDLFNKDKAIDTELQLANSGVPNKLKLAATSGMNPYVTLASQYFENDILDIASKWRPLQTSYTISGTIDEQTPSDCNADDIQEE